MRHQCHLEVPVSVHFQCTVYSVQCTYSVHIVSAAHQCQSEQPALAGVSEDCCSRSCSDDNNLKNNKVLSYIVSYMMGHIVVNGDGWFGSNGTVESSTKR